MRNLQLAENLFHQIRLTLDDLEKSRVGSETSKYYLNKLKELLERMEEVQVWDPNKMDPNKIGPVS